MIELAPSFLVRYLNEHSILIHAVSQAIELAKKIAKLRIFKDDAGKMNRSILIACLYLVSSLPFSSSVAEPQTQSRTVFTMDY